MKDEVMAGLPLAHPSSLCLYRILHPFVFTSSFIFHPYFILHPSAFILSHCARCAAMSDVFACAARGRSPFRTGRV
jgi:hypothetical protein